MINIYDLDFTEIEAYIKGLGEPNYRALQIWNGLYQLHNASWDAFSNLPKSLREKFANEFSLFSITKIESVYSKDFQTEKTLFQLADSNFIESVLLRKDDRLTLCISTQSGCPVGCVFCATGNLGFRRNLSSGEITEQVIFFINALNLKAKKLQISC